MGIFGPTAGDVEKLIREWSPRKCKTEKDFERSLIRFLESKIKPEKIVRQFAYGRLRGDIVVDKAILVEIKHNLDSTAKLQRLLGQLEIYASEWKKDVIVVLVGEQDPNLVRQLEKTMAKYNPAPLDLFQAWRMRLVKK